ncbi:MAG: phosphatidate cytidylyltransferase [Geobacteraceae bacterium]
MSIKRLATAAVGLPLLALLIFKGTPFLFACFVLLLVFLGLTEFYGMAIPGHRLAGALAAMLGSLLPLTLLSRDPLQFPAALTALLFLFSLHFLVRFQDIRGVTGELAILCFGFLYLPLLLSHLILIRSAPNGVQWIFLLLVIVMTGDSAAYYVGSSLGRKKLYPSVSPNKSVEGAVGGLAGSLAGALLFKAAFLPEMGILDCIAAALFTSVAAQVGDLFESLLKRSCGVKDSGTIIPGHGGILDRLDSILFAAPTLYWYLHFMVLSR